MNRDRHGARRQSRGPGAPAAAARRPGRAWMRWGSRQICRRRRPRSVTESFFPLPVLKTPMQIGVFIQGAALGLAVLLLATVIPLRRGLALTPVEAISVGARAAKSSGLAWLTRGIRAHCGWADRHRYPQDAPRPRALKRRDWPRPQPRREDRTSRPRVGSSSRSHPGTIPMPLPALRRTVEDARRVTAVA